MLLSEAVKQDAMALSGEQTQPQSWPVTRTTSNGRQRCQRERTESAAQPAAPCLVLPCSASPLSSSRITAWGQMATVSASSAGQLPRNVLPSAASYPGLLLAFSADVASADLCCLWARVSRAPSCHVEPLAVPAARARLTEKDPPQGSHPPLRRCCPGSTAKVQPHRHVSQNPEQKT